MGSGTIAPLTNTSGCAAEEVAQAYVSRPESCDHWGQTL